MEYQALEQGCIRLLQINTPSSSAEDSLGTPIISKVSCTLSVHSLDSCPAYEAISYTWGSPTKPHVVECSGEPFSVTENLYGLLLRLQHAESRVFWIDAICINQEDLRERDAQVQMMNKIYGKAGQVFIWLGEETVSDGAAFDLLKRYENAFAELGPFEYVGADEGMKSAGLPEQSSRSWKALANLFQRSWFMRIWVIQEAVMAKKAVFHCGSFSIDWDSVVQVAFSLNTSGVIGRSEIEEFAPGLHSVIFMAKLKAASETSLSFLLISSRNYSSTDPRDKVFALSGLAQDASAVVSSTYSSPTEEVFQSLQKHMLLADKSLAGLSDAGLNPASAHPGLPSWVPDWSYDNDRRANLTVRRCFSASGIKLSPTVSISRDDKILTVRGVVVDVISHVGTYGRLFSGYKTLPFVDVDVEERMAQMRRYMNILRPQLRDSQLIADQVCRFPHGQTREDAIWRTACCDMTPEGGRVTDAYSIGYKYCQYLISITDDRGNVDFAKLDNGLRASLGGVGISLLHSAALYTNGRRFCGTKSGYLGLVPNGTIVGDVVAIMFGGDVPFILRADGKGYYYLIGEGYIHGIMDGEVAEMMNMDAISQDFKIR